MDHSLLEKVRHLLEIGTALSSERDTKKLLEKILGSAQLLTSADGGTLYTVTPRKTLHFEISTSHSLNFNIGTTPSTVTFTEIPLFHKDGSPNESAIVAYSVNHKQLINVKDAYHETGFDFSGPRRFDEELGYRTLSVLAAPIQNHEGEVIGVLQLINAYDKKTGVIHPFSEEDQYLVESLASQAGVALTNQQLIIDLKQLFESLIRIIAKAIDEKSPSTGNHSRRVPILCEMIARAMNETGKYHFSEEAIEELKVAAFLHDCGKITTPVHIQEKHTKLETIVDRIDLLSTRFEVVKRDQECEMLQKKLKWYEEKAPHLLEERKEAFTLFENEKDKGVARLNVEEEFLRKCNRSFNLTPEMVQEVRKIATRMWTCKNETLPFLTADELENLSIVYGTLSDKERKIIENHVVLTLKMLSELIFPKHLKNVPEIAASHHERVDGKGYPRGLTKEQMSVEARILALADVFEALSAPDRPYKEPLPLSVITKILKEKGAEGHLDPELVSIFLDKKVGLSYAKEHLAPSQIDI